MTTYILFHAEILPRICGSASMSGRGAFPVQEVCAAPFETYDRTMPIVCTFFFLRTDEEAKLASVLPVLFPQRAMRNFTIILTL